MVREQRWLVVLAGAVVIASCSTDTTTSDTLSPTTLSSGGPSTTVATPPAGSGASTSSTIADASTTTTSTTSTTTSTVVSSTAPATPSSEIAAAFIGGAGDNFWLPLGYWDGSAWVQSGEESETTPLEFPAASGDALGVTGLERSPTTAALGETGEACFDGRVGFAVDVAVTEPEPPGFGYSAIAVVGDWAIQPRPTSEVGLAIDEYRQIGATFADDFGVDGTLGEVVEVVRSDLDGDGMEEVLVAFEHYEEPFGTPGAYSLVYVRAPQIDGSVTDTMVFSSFVDPGLPEEELPFMYRARVLGVADLNGDGRMEVALHIWYYEGAGVTVYEFTDRSLTNVLTNGCGA